MKRSRGALVLLASVVLYGLFLFDDTRALEFGTDPIPIEFTLNSVLTVSTDGNIAISNLTPGSKGISSSGYIITVDTNSVAGYTLSATVGCASGDGCFNTKILGDGNNNDFSMVESTTTLTPGKWGISLDSTATENSNFQTLPLYSSTAETINQTTDASGTAATGYQGTQSTTFRVGAYAADTQVAGTYTNVVNFTAVANIVANCGNYTAEFCMQNVGAWGSSLSPNQQIQAMDARDGKLYYVAKLADGNVWMTQNLDHDIVTTTDFYTYANTDIGHGATTNTNATWTAERATYATNNTTDWNNTGEMWTDPESYDPGDFCWSGILEDSTMVSCNQNGSHFHLGNFYNWTAAVAMNDSSTYDTGDIDVDQSICPAGWTLPKDGSITTSGSFQYLVTQYGWDSNNLEMTGAYSVWDSPLYFPLSGYYPGLSNVLGKRGIYWSSVYSSYEFAYIMYYGYDGFVDMESGTDRYNGNSVRCVAR